ncbi:hypothetical protein Slin15195_G100740 [Septoria linicola]|uniref:Uncharacterized protein n=1 Tax=Septoria linicola TaxID=215465 RepID=A0A9Q9B217_9PEZI|nr:hypothetical protein Slin14017_G063760 [Septoria linicola]USW56755.1 hypothetical protein Slin15195_G100740 [Septoria linicola]
MLSIPTPQPIYSSLTSSDKIQSYWTKQRTVISGRNIRWSPITVSRAGDGRPHHYSEARVKRRLHCAQQRVEAGELRKRYITEEYIQSQISESWADVRPVLFDLERDGDTNVLPVDFQIYDDDNGHKSISTMAKDGPALYYPLWNECYQLVEITLCTHCLAPDALGPGTVGQGKDHAEGTCGHDKKKGEWRKEFLTENFSVPDRLADSWKRWDNRRFFTVLPGEDVETCVGIYEDDAGMAQVSSPLEPCPSEIDITDCYRWVGALRYSKLEPSTKGRKTRRTLSR